MQASLQQFSFTGCLSRKNDLFCIVENKTLIKVDPCIIYLFLFFYTFLTALSRSSRLHIFSHKLYKEEPVIDREKKTQLLRWKVCPGAFQKFVGPFFLQTHITQNAAHTHTHTNSD